MKYSQIDLVCDVGEGFGIYRHGDDREIIKRISSACIACGFHAGDPVIMRKTIEIASKEKVAIGAHIGFPDIQGFGRRYIDFNYEDLKDYILYQLAAIDGVARVYGESVKLIKLHGALARMSIQDEKLSEILVDIIKDYNDGILILAFWNSKLSKAARAAGLLTAEEVLIDRGYQSEGRLISHGQYGAIITDQEKIFARFRLILEEGLIELGNGTTVPIDIQSIGFHAGSTEIATLQKMVDWLDEQEIKLKANI